jgi:hypothetical protein
MHMPKDQTVEIIDDLIRPPLSELTVPSKKRVRVKNLGDYYDVFGSLEQTILSIWLDEPRLTDEDVLIAINDLTHDFDDQPEGTIARELEQAVKSTLMLRHDDGDVDYTYGEVMSCLSHLVGIVRTHHSPRGTGYLTWVKTVFEGNMPTTRAEIVEYILRHEV